MEIDRSTVELGKRIVDLEAECDKLEEDKMKLKEQVMKVEKAKEKYLKLVEKFVSEERIWRQKCRELEVQNKKLKIDLDAAVSERRGNDEAVVKLRVIEVEIQCLKDKMAVETGKHKAEQQKNLDLHDKIQVLEREKELMVAEVSELKKEVSDEVEKKLYMNKVLENKKTRLEEVEKSNSELVKRNRVLESTQKAMEDKVFMFKREKSEEVKKIMKEKGDIEGEVKKLLNEKIVAEGEKIAFVDESKKTVVMLVKRIQALEEGKRQMETKCSQVNAEKDVAIKGILNEKRAVMEESKQMVVVLVKKIEALEEEKREMQDKFCQENMERNQEMERILNEKRAVDEEIERILKEKMVAETERKAFEGESEKKLGELIKRIESLEKDNCELDAIVFEKSMEKNIEMEMILNEKKAYEEKSKRKVAELIKRIEALREENAEMEAKVSRANMEKNSEMERILEEKMALKEEGENQCLERDKLIRMLHQITETLEAQKKEAEMRNTLLASTRREDVEFAHSVSNVLGTLVPTAHNHGNIKNEEQQRTPEKHMQKIRKLV